ncbi:hypothetical protein D3C87_1411410 [compost metagenome]
MPLIAVAVFQDSASPQEADPGNHALHHPAHGIGLRAGHLRHQHEQRRPHRHQHVGAHAGGLALVFTLEPENPAQQGGHQQAHGHSRQLRGIGDVGELGLQGHPDFVPPGVHAVVLVRGSWKVDRSDH